MAETTYTIRNAWGDPLFETRDADLAFHYSTHGCEVTAVTGKTQ